MIKIKRKVQKIKRANNKTLTCVGGGGLKKTLFFNEKENEFEVPAALISLFIRSDNKEESPFEPVGPPFEKELLVEDTEVETGDHIVEKVSAKPVETIPSFEEE